MSTNREPPVPAGPHWATPAEGLLAQLQSSAAGLSESEAATRLVREGPNRPQAPHETRALRLLWRQISSPLVLILVVGAAISLFVAEWWDAATLIVIVLASAGLGFGQEYRASTAMQRLRSRLALNSRVCRGGALCTVPASELVPGDVIELSAGKLVPADGVVLAADDFLVVEAALTGEPFPVEKLSGTVAADAPLRARTNCVWLGSSVRSGTARVLIVHTGGRTTLGALAAQLQATPPETDFARGVRHFGEMLLRVMVLVVVAVLVTNHALGRPVIDSMLFAMALAVGLAPELLPAIVSVSLAGGARRLGAGGVLVRRLEAIENLGGMDVLCTDKTGTLTVGVMALQAAVDVSGAPDPEVLRLAHLNAAFETGIENPIDAAIVQAAESAGLHTAGWSKIDEIPYDFVRKRLTVVVAAEGDSTRHQLLIKGAFAQVLATCSHIRQGTQPLPLDEGWRARLEAFVHAQGAQGVRVIAVATLERAAQPRYTSADENGLTFVGFLLFSDPVKPDAAATLQRLAARGIRCKILTGDNRHVATHVAQQLGLDPQALLTGEAISHLRDESLWHLAPRTDLFVELEPAHKERIVRALQHAGHAVGYLGDGINDAPALHAADVGISVDQAVDVARESADIVLLRPDLPTLLAGVEEGRRTFANTMKYITITTSANLGNMISMALATPLLPFLPLTATQVLLNNLLSDLPSMALATDRVDEASLAQAQRWNAAEVRRSMWVYGLTSSVFDLITFALLVLVLHAGAALFQTAWFVLSLLTELVVVLVLRTRGPMLQSHPGRWLLAATLGMFALALALPFVAPLARRLGFVPLPVELLAGLLLLVAVYALVTEFVKRRRQASAPGS